MDVEYCAKAVECLEDLGRGWFKDDLRIEIAEMPSIDYFARYYFRDGVRELRMIPTSVVGVKFWRLLNGMHTKMGFRYVPTQFLGCIKWTNDAGYFRDRVFILEQVDDLKPSRPGHLYRWRVKLTTRFPWYEPPCPSEPAQGGPEGGQGASSDAFVQPPQPEGKC